MNIENLTRVYFIGIGGIGMSALARYFLGRGAVVCGYDRTPTALTDDMTTEGIKIHFMDDIALLDTTAELIIYTPAIPQNHAELNWYFDNNYPVFKRSDALQWITETLFSITVAGTHGKTTVSTMIAYLLRETGYGCNAFLGGISANYHTNYWSSENKVAVIEADEYDRSFLKLKPDIALLTAMDADHLDIYGTVDAMEQAFIQYTKNTKADGTLLIKQGIKRQDEFSAFELYSYGLDNPHSEIEGKNIRINDGSYLFDVVAKDWTIDNFQLNMGGRHNVENAVAAVAVSQLLGIEPQSVKKALFGFSGVKRRFEYIIKKTSLVFIDDYAHHPEELRALISGAKELFPDLKCTICFQPHLFSRTKDFAAEFGEALSLANEVLLLDIYPARELPMPGVTSALIANSIKKASLLQFSKEKLLRYIKDASFELFITAGAGDIDKLVEPIKNILENR